MSDIREHAPSAIIFGRQVFWSDAPATVKAGGRRLRQQELEHRGARERPRAHLCSKAPSSRSSTVHARRVSQSSSGSSSARRPSSSAIFLARRSGTQRSLNGARPPSVTSRASQTSGKRKRPSIGVTEHARRMRARETKGSLRQFRVVSAGRRCTPMGHLQEADTLMRRIDQPIDQDCGHRRTVMPVRATPRESRVEQGSRRRKARRSRAEKSEAERERERVGLQIVDTATAMYYKLRVVMICRSPFREMRNRGCTSTTDETLLPRTSNAGFRQLGAAVRSVRVPVPVPAKLPSAVPQSKQRRPHHSRLLPYTLLVQLAFLAAPSGQATLNESPTAALRHPRIIRLA